VERENFPLILSSPSASGGGGGLRRILRGRR